MKKQIVSPKVVKDIELLTTGGNIPNGGDLDDYTTTGYYRIQNSSVADSLSNCPIDSEGSLLVEVANQKSTSTRCFQTVKQMTTFGTNEFKRTLTGSGWTDWSNIYKGIDITSDITMKSGVTLQCGGVYKLGNLVVLQLRFSTTGGQFQTVMEGFPVPLCTVRSGVASNMVALPSNYPDQGLYVSKEGKLMHLSICPDFTDGQAIFVAGSYICE